MSIFDMFNLCYQNARSGPEFLVSGWSIGIAETLEEKARLLSVDGPRCSRKRLGAGARRGWFPKFCRIECRETRVLGYFVDRDRCGVAHVSTFEIKAGDDTKEGLW